MASYQISERHRAIMVIGRTGTGKTNIINSMIGTKEFESGGKGFDAVTKGIQTTTATMTIDGSKYITTFIDTEGIVDNRNRKTQAQIFENIKAEISKLPNGLNCVFFVLKVSDCTEDEKKLFQAFDIHFTENIWKISSLVLTHCDKLDSLAEINSHVESFRSSESTKQVASKFPEERIIPVGLPDFDKKQSSFIEKHKPLKEKSIENLLKQLAKCSRQYRSDELVAKTCVIL